jgi:hypothetical protein
MLNGCGRPSALYEAAAEVILEWLKDDSAWIRAMQANSGTQETLWSVRAKLDILSDAVSMPRKAFQERLENFLR